MCVMIAGETGGAMLVSVRSVLSSYNLQCSIRSHMGRNAYREAQIELNEVSFYVRPPLATGS